MSEPSDMTLRDLVELADIIGDRFMLIASGEQPSPGARVGSLEILELTDARTGAFGPMVPN